MNPHFPQPLQLPQELRRRLPPLYACEEQDDPLIHVKFFTPDAQWTWYAIEFDGDDLFFGYVVGDFPELGYFRLSELRGIRGSLGLPVEIDRHFEPTPLSKVMQHLRSATPQSTA